MFNKITKLCIYGLVLLMPLFFLPFSFEAFEFNKGYLLFFLTSIGILAWLGQMVFKEKKLAFRHSKFDFFVIGYLLVMVLTTIFSKDVNSSIYGFYGRFWPSLIGTLSLGGLYFLLTNNVGKEKIELKSLLSVFRWAVLLVVVTAYFSIFGVWRLIPGLPEIMFGRHFNPVAGSLEGLSIFLAFAMSLLLVKVANTKKEKETKKGAIINYVILFAGLGILLIVNFWPAWLILIISLVLFLVFSFWKRLFKEDVNHLALPILFAIIGLILLVANPFFTFFSQNSVTADLPAEILLRQKASWQLGAEGIIGNPVFGSGLGNFGFTFARYKPESFLENNPLWYLRLDRAGNAVSEAMATTGFVGTVAWLVLVGGFLFLVIGLFRKGKNKKSLVDKVSTLPLVIGFTALLVGQLVYYQNTALAFAFWLMIGLAAVFSASGIKEKEFGFSKFPEVGLLFSIVFWVVLVGFTFLYFNTFQQYLADVNYRQYLVNPTGNLEHLEKSARLAPNRTTFHIALARAYLAKFSDEVNKAEPDARIVEQMVALAISEIRLATEKSPNQVAVQETSGMIYRDIQGLAQGAGEWAVKSFEKALELEPKNPIFLSELGKLRLAENEEEAIELFQQAVGIKNDYVDANLQLAIIDEKAGRVDEAIKRLESLVASNLYSIEARFHLGRVYYNNGNLNRAEEQFITVLQLFPNHSNSLYSLALVYEKQGKKAEALELYRQVLELNPNNEDVKGKIKGLE